jgi:hypothetical protein
MLALRNLDKKRYSIGAPNSWIKILSLTQSACDSDTDKNVCATVKEYKRQIDKLVYKLYELTDEEIKIVEGEVYGKK